MSRANTALRILANAGAPHLPAAQGSACQSSSMWCHLGQHARGLLATCASAAHAPWLSSWRQMSAAAPSNPEGNTIPPPKSATGQPSDRPAATASLKDLLQVSSHRISQGEVGRLSDVSGDLAEAAEAAHVEASLLLQQQQPEGAEAPSALELEHQAAGGSGEVDGVGGSQQQQQQRLFHPKYGYAALGGVVPGDDAAGVAGLVGMLTAQHPRVNPRKKFMPGETYEPQDLNPFSARSAEKRRPTGLVLRPNVAEVLEKADYKNVAFLSRWFLSPAGRMLPRRQTRLPVHVHKHVSRQIKQARHMGLMAGEARLDKMHLGRLREQELAEAQRRAAGGGGYNEMLDFGA